MAPSRSRRASDRPRRQRVWARNYGVLGAVTAAAPQFADLLAPYVARNGATVPGITIGKIWLDLCVTRAAGTDPLPSVIAGVQVGPESLEAVDEAPADTIAGGVDQDWMWWRKMYVPQDGVTAANFQSAYHIEISSMRRMERISDRLRLVAQAPAAGGDTFTVSFGSSVLLVLP